MAQITQVITIHDYNKMTDEQKAALSENNMLAVVQQDWQQARIHAAIAAMQAELSNPNNTFMMCEDKRAIIVRRAVGYADALITELQKKDEMMKPSNGISVTFLKGKDGLWHSYTAYAEDVDYETMVKFSNCIGNAVDALNKKGGEE